MLVAMRRLEWRNAFAAAMSEESTLDDLYHTVDDESLLLHLLPRDTKSPHGDDVDFFFFDKLVNHSTFDFHRVRYAVTCKPQFYKQNDDEVPTRRALLRYINHPKMDDEGNFSIVQAPVLFLIFFYRYHPLFWLELPVLRTC